MEQDGYYVWLIARRASVISYKLFHLGDMTLLEAILLPLMDIDTTINGHRMKLFFLIVKQGGMFLRFAPLERPSRPLSRYPESVAWSLGWVSPGGVEASGQKLMFCLVLVRFLEPY